MVRHSAAVHQIVTRLIATTIPLKPFQNLMNLQEKPNGQYREDIQDVVIYH
jgi:hypothetical protein